MTLDLLLAHPAVQALGRALLHFVWQGSLLALLLWIVKAIAPPSAARLRYAAANLIMLMMPLVLTVTAARERFDEDQQGKVVNVAAVNRPGIQSPVTKARLIFYGDTPSAPPAGITGWVVCIWIIGVLLLSLRAAGGWLGAQRLKRRVGPISVELQDIVRRLKVRLRVSASVRVCTSALVRVPTVVGWLRPCIFLPVTALTGLSESQIRAILAHELAHIRRHDYLFNLLQTAIETLLFYHPAVWWVGTQMRMEREHCCDDVAVAVCGSAREYAGALAEMEEIRDRVPEPALAASGGELVGRIRRLLCGEDHTSQSAGTIVTAALMLSIAGFTAIFSLRAAPQETQPAFEVASVKPNKSEFGAYTNIPLGGESAYAPTGGVFSATNIPLALYIYFAYNLTGNQMKDAMATLPQWTFSERFDIQAHAASKSPTLSEVRAMLRSLLRDRFKFDAHYEMRQGPVFALVQRKNGRLGPSLRRHPADADCSARPPYSPAKAGTSFPALCGGLVPMTPNALGNAKGGASNVTMEYIASNLITMGHLDRPVVDRTGLKGTFDFSLEFVSELPALPNLSPQPDPVNPRPDPQGPSFTEALSDQLGLRLESSRGEVRVLLIDHVERPSEN